MCFVPDIFFILEAPRSFLVWLGPVQPPPGSVFCCLWDLFRACSKSPRLRQCCRLLAALSPFPPALCWLLRPPPSQDAQELLGKERTLHSVQTTDAACSGQESCSRQPQAMRSKPRVVFCLVLAWSGWQCL